MRVRLLVDLTKYHHTLTPGVEGEMIGTFGSSSRNNPQTFVGVRFPGKTLDVMRNQLEVVRDAPQEEPAGPQLTVQSTTPPKRDSVVEFAGVRFKVLSIQERLAEDLWLLNLTRC